MALILAKKPRGKSNFFMFGSEIRLTDELIDTHGLREPLRSLAKAVSRQHEKVIGVNYTSITVLLVYDTVEKEMSSPRRTSRRATRPRAATPNREQP